MHRTESQQQASRDNGSRSHGPVTPEGKARSSQNGTTHGLFSDTILLKNESREAWNRLCTGLVTRFRPADDVELGLIHEMATASWRSQRASALERAILDIETDIIDITDEPSRCPEDDIRKAAMAYCKAAGRDKALLELGRQSIRLNNLWIRLHSKLKELQKDRLAAEPPATPVGPEPATAPAPEKSKSEPVDPQTSSFQQDPKSNQESARTPEEPSETKPTPCTGK